MLFNAVNDNGSCGSQFCALQVAATVATADERPYQIRKRAAASRSNDARNTIRLRGERPWHAAAPCYNRDLRLGD